MGLVTGRIGRRGAFLLFLAVLDFVYGWALKLAATPQQAHALHLLLPWQFWAITWPGVGVVCLIGAFLKKDVWAFVLAAALKTAWASVSLALWMQGKQPNGWLSTVVWMAFAATVLVVSSWPEVSHPKVVDAEGEARRAL